MNLRKEELADIVGVKILAEEDGRILGWVYLYILRNDLHQQPFGYLENLYVNESSRSRGIGSEILFQAITEAKERKCYKLIGTSRHDNQRAHKFYDKHGFKNFGSEFRLDF